MVASEFSYCSYNDGIGTLTPRHQARSSAGQGFGQAAEDAHSLATALQDHGLVPVALRAFESMRWERVSRIGKIEQVYLGFPPCALRYRLCVIARLPDSVSLQLMG